ncbi:amino acid decarboxylase [Streptomyces chrestomyceticus JCM 4735]|uniref:Amino acid decarboxylase n=1 Tax=Streptomyces chrestomyceticus JCM 4735 TaxID=1306181 RepID=A0A7U9L2N6_9ACTN|nr:pyridoxal-dependent decarboxylase [Streptomyces chrestomyceticus]GCD38451.1 amino acid decarboxylase [Streptomyces chrestomyceticus JCM 4735]
MNTPPLAGGAAGPDALRPLLGTVLDALRDGAEARGGPLPAGGPGRVAARLREATGPVLPETGRGPHEALHALVRALAEGAADPADPHCAAHLHCPPLALAAAADLAAAALNPSMDSWDQAPAASALEARTARELAALVYPYGPDGPAHPYGPDTSPPPYDPDDAPLPYDPEDSPHSYGPGSSPSTRQPHTSGTPHHLKKLTHPYRPATPTLPGRTHEDDQPDALVTTGGTESNQLGLLLAREHARTRYTEPLRVVCGANAHHSVHRAAWLLGLPEPLTLPTPDGTLDPLTLHTALTDLRHPGSPGAPTVPVLVCATAGTTDTGAIDPLPALADLTRAHGARLHVDAAYGGPLLFSATHRHLLDGLHRAHTVTLDLHKLGWQPVAAGLLAVPRAADLAPLTHRAAYLNADDDTEAGLPDLLGRSLRTTRRPDILKMAVTLQALGRTGLADLVDRTLAAARTFAGLIDDHPAFELHSHPTLSTVLFRPTGADDTTVATIRRRLLHQGRAVLGRAATPTGLWLKATLLNPHTTTDDLASLLKLVEGHTPR